MDINFRSISSFSQASAEGLNSVMEGITASVDAGGLGSVQNNLDHFGEVGENAFTQAVFGDSISPASAESSFFSAPSDYLKRVPDDFAKTSISFLEVLSNLEDSNFDFSESLSTFQGNVFKEGALTDFFTQLGTSNPLTNVGVMVPPQVGNPLTNVGVMVPPQVGNPLTNVGVMVPPQVGNPLTNVGVMVPPQVGNPLTNVGVMVPPQVGNPLANEGVIGSPYMDFAASKLEAMGMVVDETVNLQQSLSNVRRFI